MEPVDRGEQNLVYNLKHYIYTYEMVEREVWFV